MHPHTNTHTKICSHTGETRDQIIVVYCFALIHQHNYRHLDGRAASID